MACVVPKDDCTHVQDITLRPEKVDLSAPCRECGDASENWLCIGCYGVFCSRYVKGHMRKHNEETKHPIALSFSDLSIWCYECDAYVSQKTMNIVYHAHMIKHGCPPGDATVSKEEMDQIKNIVFGVGSDDFNPENYVFYDDEPSKKQKSEDTKNEADQNNSQTTTTSTSTSTNTDNNNNNDKITNSTTSTTSTASATSATSAKIDIVPIEGLDSATILSNKVLDRILGCIYGNCLGDAVGLSTEFLNKQQIKEIYGNKLIPFPNFVRNFHNSRWKLGDWTDDSDQMILILETLLERGQADPPLYAKKLYNWIRNGFPELGDKCGMGLGATTARVTDHPKFLKDPISVAYEVWDQTGRKMAPNGGVMRTSVVGCFEFNNTSTLLQTCDSFCKVTHADPRCVASCRAVVLAIATLLQDAQRQTHLHPAQSRDEILGAIYAKVREHTHDMLKERPSDLKDFEKYLTAKTLEEMELDENNTIGYTFKAMGCGFWGLRSESTFEETLEKLAKEGGDADTNGAVCGALIGCRIGYSALPAGWLRALPNKRWLDEKVVQFLKKCGRI